MLTVERLSLGNRVPESHECRLVLSALHALAARRKAIYPQARFIWLDQGEMPDTLLRREEMPDTLLIRSTYSATRRSANMNLVHLCDSAELRRTSQLVRRAERGSPGIRSVLPRRVIEWQKGYEFSS